MSKDSISLKKNSNFTTRFLNVIEKGGNALPHPGTLFLILSFIVILVSFIGSKLGWSVEFMGINRRTLESKNMLIEVRSLASKDGLNYIFTNMVTNFTGFAPLGTVLVAIIGIGVCEKSGLMGTLLRKLTMSTSKKYLTPVIIFLGIVSNITADASYIIFPPLAALVFLSFKRHPLAGLAAAFAGVSGGMSANLLITGLDPLLGGISTEAAKILDPNYLVLPVANYFFMFVSTFVITIVGTFITEKIVEPRLGEFHVGDTNYSFEKITPDENKALKSAGIVTLIILLLFIPLWNILGSNFLGEGLIPIIVLIFAIPGLVYGRSIGVIKSDSDAMRMISESFAAMSGYIVLVFFAAQFIAFFNYSNLGTIISVNGAEFLKMSNITGIPLILGFIFIVGLLNLFMGSASAKWAILAPVFIPMLMQVGYTPEFTQLAYRIGDSATNIISPLMSFFAMMIVYMQKYDKKSSIGTLISTMLPYSIAFMISWSALLIVWMLLGLPIGPGIGMTL